MSLKVDVLARAELRRAVVWYEEQRPSLGAELAAAIGRALREIERAPERWPVWHLEPRVRRYVLQRFPFAVVYVIRDSGPYVVAIAHTSRSARRWLDRISPKKVAKHRR